MDRRQDPDAIKDWDNAERFPRAEFAGDHFTDPYQVGYYLLKELDWAQRQLDLEKNRQQEHERQAMQARIDSLLAQQAEREFDQQAAATQRPQQVENLIKEVNQYLRAHTLPTKHKKFTSPQEVLWNYCRSGSKPGKTGGKFSSKTAHPKRQFRSDFEALAKWLDEKNRDGNEHSSEVVLEKFAAQWHKMKGEGKSSRRRLALACTLVDAEAFEKPKFN